MSALKDQDPDYGPSVATNEKHQRIYEENARSSTARKITAIVEKEFSQEIANKEREILEIQERLHKTLKTLHLLRYVVVADFYGRKQCQNSQVGEAKQTQIHPAIKQLIGKSPKIYETSLVAETFNEQKEASSSLENNCSIDAISEKRLEERNVNDVQSCENKRRAEDEDFKPKKIPRYVPPKSGLPESPNPSRNARHKVRKRIIVGNISKWIPLDWREDAASHKWTMYVRGNKENPDIDDFVTKVRFFLHPSYRPNDVVEVTSAPFCLSRRGWGEFPVRVQLHFKSVFDKPMDIIHHLKLDRTYTGLQTLGSETLVDIWIYGESRNSKKNTEKDELDLQDNVEDKTQLEVISVKTESVDTFVEPKTETTDFAKGIEDVINKSVDQEELKSFVVDNHKVYIEATGSHINRLRYCVNFDHDYLGSMNVNEFRENNLTIKHSLSPKLSNSLKTEDSNVENDIHFVKQANEFNTRLENVEKFNAQQENVNNAINKSSQNNSRVVLGPSSILQNSTLQPLRISIPSPFEPTPSKRVLVLQNDKTIPVDIATSRSNNLSGLTAGSKIKINLSQSRGLSLLKKRPTLENGKDTGTDTHQNVSSSIKIRPSTSILLNVASNIPTLKIADSLNCPASNICTSSANSVSSSAEEQQKSIVKHKITLGEDKYKIQSRKDIYEKVFQTIELAKISDVLGLLRFVIKRLPIITPDANDPEYRRLHPYACKNEEEFFTYSTAKRSALEWNRASMTRQFLAQKISSEERNWSVKEIMIWARLHGYTPICTSFNLSGQIHSEEAGNITKSTSSTSHNIYTTTEPLTFHKWLRNYPESSKENSASINKHLSEETEIIDVENSDSTESTERTKKEYSDECPSRIIDSSKVTVLELNKSLVPLYEFVSDSTRQIGIRLSSEEIIPNVVHCAAGRMIMKAVECFVDELVRGSLAKAWERPDNNGYPKVVALNDVRQAILNRKEFDLFTNEGLGSNYASMLAD